MTPLRRRTGRVPLAQWLRQQRRARLGGAILLTLLLSLLLLWRGSAGPGAWADVTLHVAEVEKGFLLHVRDAQGARRAVRLLGLLDQLDGLDGMGMEADGGSGTAWLRDVCLGGPIMLELEAGAECDAQGRLLAYAYLPDGRMVNEELIRLGLARTDAVTPHRLREWFKRLEARARD